MRRIETYDWWPDLVALKDELSLRELAERFNVTPGAISAAFKRTGTVRKPAPPGPRSRRKRSTEDLPPEPGDTATPPTPKPRPGSKDHLILPHLDMLGSIPDAEVANRAGVSVRTIASFRSRNQIPGYAGPRRSTGSRGPRQSKIDPFANLLGKVPDRVVAERAGVSLNAVRNYRVKRGIPAAGRSRSSDVPAMGATPGEGSNAWRVTLQDGSTTLHRVVVADSLVDAAARAEEAGLGHVVGLDWVGELL